jgi:hypothetical protein
MNGSLRAIVSLTAATVGVLGQGCSDTPYVDTSQTEVTVSGVVKVKGQPASGGQISFNPSNRDRKVPAFTAPIGPDGSYTIKTYTGENEVRFAGDVNKAYPMVGMIKKFCIVTGSGQHEDFDLLGEPDSQSPKLKYMDGASTKGKVGGQRGRGR